MDDITLTLTPYLDRFGENDCQVEEGCHVALQVFQVCLRVIPRGRMPYSFLAQANLFGSG